MKIQELAMEYSAEWKREHVRRLKSGEYKYFDADPLGKISGTMQNEIEIAHRLTDLVKKIGTASSENERSALYDEIMSRAKEGTISTGGSLEQMDLMTTRVSRRSDYINRIAPIIQELTINIQRTGSPLIMMVAQDFLDAAGRYNGMVTSSQSEELINKMELAMARLESVIGEVLNRGPFIE